MGIPDEEDCEFRAKALSKGKVEEGNSGLEEDWEMLEEDCDWEKV